MVLDDGDQEVPSIGSLSSPDHLDELPEPDSDLGNGEQFAQYVGSSENATDEEQMRFVSRMDSPDPLEDLPAPDPLFGKRQFLEYDGSTENATDEENEERMDVSGPYQERPVRMLPGGRPGSGDSNTVHNVSGYGALHRRFLSEEALTDLPTPDLDALKNHRFVEYDPSYGRNCHDYEVIETRNHRHSRFDNGRFRNPHFRGSGRARELGRRRDA